MLNLLHDALNLFWRTNKAMTLFFLSNFVFLGIGIVGMVFDPRQVLNAPTWAKDVKFSISLLFYTSTMLWMFSYINIRPRIKSFVLTASAVILFVEMLMIVLQGARAVPIHFNVSTPFDTALWSAMSVSIMIFYGISIAGFILFLRQPLADRTLAWSMKLGMAIMLVGFGVAFLMTGPRPDQLEQMQNGLAPAMMGAHTIGAPDGGPGLPLLGWSTRYGDLRIAHFVGIHGPQALTLFGLALILIARRSNNRLSETHRLLMIAGAFVTYLGIVLIVTWQALRMQPITAPDTLTLTAFVSLVVAFFGYNGLVVWHAYSKWHRHLEPIGGTR
jgi:hypothetical protein